ncbi:hypothetical protein [Haloplasma contractile]|uniref:Uncharacterized protein n=1 Tax=Haloplasma contractile SSD-17B TaxID=1033810 RepID=U2FLL4_9MOLU|nr:hypothetical protein [Haloplasma contractile]ERJ12069.1 hypothetical protein HLPCO_001983 [Haloplasma contractile SSD-17B]
MNYTRLNSLVKNIKIGDGEGISEHIQKRSNERLNRYFDIREDEITKIKTKKAIEREKGRQLFLETNEALSVITSSVYRLSKKNVGWFFMAGSISTLMVEQYVKRKLGQD